MAVRKTGKKRVAERKTMVRIGDRKMESVGLPRSWFGNLYHVSMMLSWPAFLLIVIIVTVAINALFAVVMMADPSGIANMPADKPWWAFYFSMETLATVGYGDMHPASEFIHLVASAEMIIGLLLTALMTGMIFARFSQPRARFMFSNIVVIGRHDGRDCLMLRVANGRQNTIGDARAKLWCLMTGVTEEGTPYRRFTELPLLRNENPTFVLSWTLFHPIDASSPLHGMTAEDFEARDIGLVLTVSGHDETVSQPIQGRHNYSRTAIRWHHQFVDILSNSADGTLLVDYRKFHDSLAEA